MKLNKWFYPVMISMLFILAGTTLSISAEEISEIPVEEMPVVSEQENDFIEPESIDEEIQGEDEVVQEPTEADSVSTVFVENSYDSANPQIIEYDDGDKLSVWIGMDNTRYSYDRSSLYWSYYSNNTWSTPAQVENDGTADWSPVLEKIDNTGYLAWMNAKQSYKNISMDNNALVASYTEVSAGVFDRSNKKFSVKKLTNDSYIDSMPDFGGENGSVYLAWNKNLDNSWFAEGSKNNIYYSTYSNGSWSNPTAKYSNVGTVSEVCAGGTASSPKIAYILDVDKDFVTVEDLQVYLNGKQLTNNSSGKYRLTYLDGTFYWLSSNQLVSYDGSMHQFETLVQNDSRFYLKDDQLVIIEKNIDGLYSSLSKKTLNLKSGQCGELIQLGTNKGGIQFYSVYLDKDGLVHGVYNLRTVIGTEAYGSSNIYLFNENQVYSIKVTNVEYDPAYYAEGYDLPIYFEITNTGNTLLDTYTVTLEELWSGTVLATSKEYTEANVALIKVGERTFLDNTGNTVLYPGQSRRSFIPYTAGSTKCIEAVLTVEITDKNGKKYTDSSFLTIDSSDVGIQNETCTLLSNNVLEIAGNVVYWGEGTQKNVVVSLYQDSLDGTLLKTYTISSLTNGVDERFAFTVTPPKNKQVYYIGISRMEKDYDTQNNSTFVVYNPANTSDDIFVEALFTENKEITISENLPLKDLNIYYRDNGTKVMIPVSDLTWKSSNQKIFTIENDKISIKGFGKADLIVQHPVSDVTLTVSIITKLPFPFKDVSKDAWYYNTAKECYETGLISGTSETTFSPMQEMTRAMVVTILWRMEGEPKVTFNNKFKDVSSKQWYASSISWAVNNGVVHGYGDGTFKPDAAVTREQVAVMLMNFTQYKNLYEAGTKKLNTYPDGSQVSTWAQSGMKWAISNGIISGNGAGYLNPKKSANRAEGAAMILRMKNFAEIEGKKVVATGQCGGKDSDVTWTYYKNGLLDISGSGKMQYHSAQEEFAWYPYFDQIKKVMISEDITYVSLGTLPNIKTAGPVGSGSDYEFEWTAAIPDRAFYNCTNLTSVVIPDSVTSVGEYSFANCESLENIKIPSSVFSIGDWAFENCKNLANFALPNSVISLGEGTFYSCYNLTNITIPSGISNIQGWTFENCIGLISITIPKSVTSIGTAAFYYCSSLKDVYYEGTKADWESKKLYSFDASVTIHFLN